MLFASQQELFSLKVKINGNNRPSFYSDKSKIDSDESNSNTVSHE